MALWRSTVKNMSLRVAPTAATAGAAATLCFRWTTAFPPLPISAINENTKPKTDKTAAVHAVTAKKGRI